MLPGRDKGGGLGDQQGGGAAGGDPDPVGTAAAGRDTVL